MSKLFSHNAYNILGLDSSATQKEISRQSKKLAATLGIEESVSLPNDIDVICKPARNEIAVKHAAERLNSPVKRILEYFFWFEVGSKNDEHALDLLRANRYDEALELWQAHTDKSPTALRNLAIASSIIFESTGYKKYLMLSLGTWKTLVSSDKFWPHFEKVYNLNDEIGTSKETIIDFRDNLSDQLSDFYSDISNERKDDTMYQAYIAALGVKSKKVHEEVLSPIFDQIHKGLKELEGIKIADDDTALSNQDSILIKRVIKRLDESFQKMKNLGLYDDSDAKSMRDEAAKVINTLATSIYNGLGDFKKSLYLYKFALSLAVGPARVSRIKENIAIVRQIEESDKIIAPMNALIEKESFSEALELINQAAEKNHKNKALQEYLTKRTQLCVIAITVADMQEASSLFERGEYEQAQTLYKAVFNFAHQYVDSFDIDEDSLQNDIAWLRQKLESITASTYAYANTYKQQLIVSSSDIFSDSESHEAMFYSLLMEAMIGVRLAELAPSIKRLNSAKNVASGFGRIIWNIIVWGLIILFISWVSGAFSGGSSSNSGSSGSSSSSSSSSSSAWQTCSDEYDSLKDELDDIESQMKSYESSGYADAYNDLVPRQNSLVRQVNAKATECNNLR